MQRPSTNTHAADGSATPGRGNRSRAGRVAAIVAAAAIALSGMLAGQMQGASATADGGARPAKATHVATKHRAHRHPARSKSHKKAAHKRAKHQHATRHAPAAEQPKTHAAKPAPVTAPVAAPTPVTRDSGTPGAANTGVPAGTKLTVHEGDLNITKAGTVINGLDVHGAIKVGAPNVTIENSIIRFRAGGATDGIHSYSTGLKIIDTEIAPTTPSPDYNGVMGSGFTATRLNIHGVVDAVHIYGNNDVIQNSWLHDNAHYDHDPNWNGNPSHDDSIQIVSGTNIRIIGNNYDNAHNSGIQITQASGTVSNVTIDGNVAGGGGCSINVAEAGGHSMSGIVVTNNRFYRDQRLSGCAIIRPQTTPVTASGNTWLDNGAQVSVKNG